MSDALFSRLLTKTDTPASPTSLNLAGEDAVAVSAAHTACWARATHLRLLAPPPQPPTLSSAARPPVWRARYTLQRGRPCGARARDIEAREPDVCVEPLGHGRRARSAKLVAPDK